MRLEDLREGKPIFGKFVSETVWSWNLILNIFDEVSSKTSSKQV